MDILDGEETEDILFGEGDDPLFSEHVGSDLFGSSGVESLVGEVSESLLDEEEYDYLFDAEAEEPLMGVDDEAVYGEESADAENEPLSDFSVADEEALDISDLLPDVEQDEISEYLQATDEESQDDTGVTDSGTEVEEAATVVDLGNHAPLGDHLTIDIGSLNPVDMDVIK